MKCLNCPGFEMRNQARPPQRVTLLRRLRFTLLTAEHITIHHKHLGLVFDHRDRCAAF